MRRCVGNNLLVLLLVLVIITPTAQTAIKMTNPECRNNDE